MRNTLLKRSLECRSKGDFDWKTRPACRNMCLWAKAEINELSPSWRQTHTLSLSLSPWCSVLPWILGITWKWNMNKIDGVFVLKQRQRCGGRHDSIVNLVLGKDQSRRMTANWNKECCCIFLSARTERPTQWKIERRRAGGFSGTRVYLYDPVWVLNHRDGGWALEG